MNVEQQLGAVFADRTTAAAAVEALRRLGLADEHLGIAVHQPDSHVFEADLDTEVAHGIERGIVIGAPLGAIAGMTIMAVVVPGVGALGVGGVLAAGGLPGAVAGTYLGGLLGLATEGHVVDEEGDWESVRLKAEEVLLVVAGHGHTAQVASVIKQHGGRIVDKPPRLS